MKKASKLVIATLMASVTLFASCGKGKEVVEKYDMLKVKGGSLPQEFIELLGEDNDFDENFDENPDLKFTVSDFFISKYEVTQQFYQEVMESDLDVNANPAYFKENPVGEEEQGLRPVERISWYDCLYFCNKLSEKEGLEPVYTIEDIQRYSKDKAIKSAKVSADFTKNGYRLPTYAEWAYAAIGGVKSTGLYKYSGSDDISTIAWHVNNSGEKTHQVGLKEPNELGLYDMTGNVAEWLWDYLWDEEGYDNKEYVNFTGPETGRYRFITGGCFIDYSAGAEFPYEIYDSIGGIQGLRYYNTGFRLARNASSNKKKK